MTDIIHNIEDTLIFSDELEAHSTQDTIDCPRWRVMIIDDDPDVHSATMFALGNLEIQQRPLSFLHAYSATEAREILANELDIAVILLDVAMEHEDAGLKLIHYIRNTLAMTDVRIILRTGQPGYAPEIDAIRDYDINDYKTKSELTRTKLYTTITSAIRSYEQICTISANRRGLEQIVNASTELMRQTGLQNFSYSVLQQITQVLGNKAEGIVCLHQGAKDNDYGIDDLWVIATTQNFSSYREQAITKLNNLQINSQLIHAIKTQQNIFESKTVTLYFDNGIHQDIFIYIETDAAISELSNHLLRVLCSNISVGLNNVTLTSRLHKYAYFDPLTGLANRLKLLHTLAEMLGSDAKGGNILSLIDIDHFAETNDALGHQFGDVLLCAVAKRLLTHFGASCSLARISGDTFALLGDEKFVTPTKIFSVFNHAFDVDDQEVQLSATIGLVRLENYDGDASDALKDTNIALKRAKSYQRSSYSYFTRDMGVAIRERVRMMHALRAAFENQHLFVVYQPQIDMRTQRAVGAEALLRWQTEDGRFIPPDQFIPIAEYSGLIIDIGEWVLRSACFELVHLRELGFLDFQMAINVSQVQFSHPQFMQTLERALQDSKAPPHCIELEITESMAMTDPNLLIETLQKIKQLGAHVSIDDFGTGFSSLSHLQKLNVDKLKIDRAFINEIGDRSGEGSIAKMIIQLSQSLHMKVIAEGVETHHQAETLLSFGCHLAQGFLYSKPKTKEDLREWLNHQSLASKKEL